MTAQEIKDFKAKASYLNAEQLENALKWRIKANAAHIANYGITLAEGEAMEKYMSDQGIYRLTVAQRCATTIAQVNRGNQQMTFTFDDNTFSDLHKDTYGFRPCSSTRQQWDCSSDEDKEIWWNHMCDTMQENEVQEAEQELIRLGEFRQLCKTQMESFNISWKTAMRWLSDADGYDIDANDQQLEGFLWSQGISWEQNRKIGDAYRWMRG